MAKSPEQFPTPEEMMDAKNPEMTPDQAAKATPEKRNPTFEDLQKKFTIKLPEDPELVAKLQRKLDEYNQRSKQGGMEQVLASEKDNPKIANHLYKVFLLGKLITDKSINYDQTRNMAAISEQIRMGGKFNEEEFDAAFDLIKAYAEGEKTRGGTGLK